MIPVCLHVTHSDLLHVYLTCQQCPGMATVMAMGVVIMDLLGELQRAEFKEAFDEFDKVSA